MNSRVPQQNCYLIDWFSFTSKTDTVHSMIDLLCLPDDCVFQENPRGAGGKYGYRKTYTFGHINIYTDHFKNDGVMVDMSGQGCRTFDTYSHFSFTYLIQLIYFNPDIYNITRIDLAYDDFSGTLDFNQLIKSTFNVAYVSKWHKNYKTAEYNGAYEAWSIMFGRKCSDIYCRFYDKAAERGYDPNELNWIRCEIVLKHDRAMAFISEHLSGKGIGECFFGILNNYIRFIVPDSNQTNISRLKTASWWSEFLQFVTKLKLFVKKDTQYNLSRLQNYLVHQVGNVLDVFRKTIGWDQLEELIKKRPSQLTSQQKLLITDYWQWYSDFILGAD